MQSVWRSATGTQWGKARAKTMQICMPVVADIITPRRAHQMDPPPSTNPRNVGEFEAYKQSQDTRPFLDYYRVKEHADECQNLRLTLPFMHSVFSKIECRPESYFLDFGCGPVLSNVISASRAFGNIVMCDIANSSLEEIRKWREGDERAFDWTHAFTKVAELEGNGCRSETISTRIGNRLKALVLCDILQDDILLGSEVPRVYDAISACFVLRLASRDLSAYKANVKKLSDILKPGGILVLCEDVNYSFHAKPHFRNIYGTVHLTEEDVREAILDAGLSITSFQRKDFVKDHIHVDQTTCFLSCLKQ